MGEIVEQWHVHLIAWNSQGYVMQGRAMCRDQLRNVVVCCVNERLFMGVSVFQNC